MLHMGLMISLTTRNDSWMYNKEKLIKNQTNDESEVILNKEHIGIELYMA